MDAAPPVYNGAGTLVKQLPERGGLDAGSPHDGVGVNALSFTLA